MSYEYTLKTDVITVEKTLAENIPFHWKGKEIILEKAGIRAVHNQKLNEKKCHEAYVILSQRCDELVNELFEEIAVEGYLSEEYLRENLPPQPGCSL